jgi:hypothetical protein
MRSIIIILTLLITSLTAQAQTTGFAVVELFTSQGCNTCPPADAVLSEIITDANKNRKPVYCIAFHVDYWNRLGWKDPYSSFKYTNRQKNYSSVLKEEMYTPQVIVNGTTSILGSDKTAIKNSIARELQTPASVIIDFKYSILNDTLLVDYKVDFPPGKNKARRNEYLNVCVTENGLGNKVTKGENTGKTLKHEKVARLLHTVDLMVPGTMLKIPLKGLKPSPNKEILLFVQEKYSRKISGAHLKSFYN